MTKFEIESHCKNIEKIEFFCLVKKILPPHTITMNKNFSVSTNQTYDEILNIVNERYLYTFFLNFVFLYFTNMLLKYMEDTKYYYILCFFVFIFLFRRFNSILTNIAIIGICNVTLMIKLYYKHRY